MSKTPKLGIRVDEDTNLCMLEERHAQELYDLVDANRAYLREWLPWVDYETSVEDSKAFIKHALQQFASNEGFQEGILRDAEWLYDHYVDHFIFGMLARDWRADDL